VAFPSSVVCCSHSPHLYHHRRFNRDLDGGLVCLPFQSFSRDIGQLLLVYRLFGDRTHVNRDRFGIGQNRSFRTPGGTTAGRNSSRSDESPDANEGDNNKRDHRQLEWKRNCGHGCSGGTFCELIVALMPGEKPGCSSGCLQIASKREHPLGFLKG